MSDLVCAACGKSVDGTTPWILGNDDLLCDGPCITEWSHKLTSRLKSAEDKIERMKGLLKELEWPTAPYAEKGYCNFCDEPNFVGHKSDCKLWKEIQEGK